LISAESPLAGPLPHTEAEMKQNVPDTSRRDGDEGVNVNE